MKTESSREYYLKKYQHANVSFLINRKLIIHKQLEKPRRTYPIYSDLHGSYEKFTLWMENGLGHYKIAIQDIFGNKYHSSILKLYEKLLLLVNRSRIQHIKKHVDSDKEEQLTQEEFIGQKIDYKFVEVLNALEKQSITKAQILEDLLTLLRLITRGDEHRIIKVIPSWMFENILKLYLGNTTDESYHSLITGIVSDEKIFAITSALIVKLTLTNIFDKHVNLGDTFDRGPDADRLIDFYMNYFGPATNESALHYIWGNHDLLWLGAALGNPIQVITALRISLRYGNNQFLKRYGIDLSRLQAMALKHYKHRPTGDYLKADDGSTNIDTLKMCKALLVLEAKLHVTYLKELTNFQSIDYKKEYHFYKKLLEYFPADVSSDPKEWEKMMKENPLYSDVYFPTIDKNNPTKLSKDEIRVVLDLVKQFKTLPKLQKHANWLFEKGEAYRVIDHTLYIHAAVPIFEDGTFCKIYERGGKELLDFLQIELKRLWKKHKEHKHLTKAELMLPWYLWSGEYSPFFCKDKMGTVERAIFNKEIAAQDPITTWKDRANAFYKKIKDDQFLDNLLATFYADRVCMGHTPIKSIDQGVIGNGLKAFLVDGGASTAYGDKGAVLIDTPDGIYLTVHPSTKQLKESKLVDDLPPLEILTLSHKSKEKIRNTEKGAFLKIELDAINEILDEDLGPFFNKYFTKKDH